MTTRASRAKHQVQSLARARASVKGGRSRTRPEDQLQRAYLEWLAAAHPDLREATIHVPNQGTASRTRGAILAGMGVSPGVPDLLCFAPRGPFRGMAIELKSKGRKPTPRQWAWIHRLAAAGWYVGYVDDLDLAQEAVRRYVAHGPPGRLGAPLVRPGPQGDSAPDQAAASGQGASGGPGRDAQLDPPVRTGRQSQG